MKELYLATTNKGKVQTIQQAFEGTDIVIKHLHTDLPEPRSDDLQLIAKTKVLFAFEQCKKPVLAMDAGFYIPSLGGFPKAFVNFALETIGIEGILKLVENKPREAYFRNCLAYYDGTQSEPIFFESETHGVLLNAPSNKKRAFWSDLHTIFLPEESSKTVCEMSDEEYSVFSKDTSRHNFARKFSKWFQEKK